MLQCCELSYPSLRYEDSTSQGESDAEVDEPAVDILASVGISCFEGSQDETSS